MAWPPRIINGAIWNELTGWAWLHDTALLLVLVLSRTMASVATAAKLVRTWVVPIVRRQKVSPKESHLPIVLHQARVEDLNITRCLCSRYTHTGR
jgi:hypothetical protein